MAKVCNSCNSKEMATMPIAQHEKDQSRLMSIIKWLISVIIILVILLVGSNVGWLIYENQFETIETTAQENIVVDADNKGNANYIGNNGDIINGKDNN